MLSLEYFNNSQKLLIMGFILYFSRNYLSGEKSYWISYKNFELRKKFRIFIDYVIRKILI